MEKDEILSILKVWNFWHQNVNTGIKRGYYQQRIASLINEPAIDVVIETGVRRAGKSFIAKQAAKKLIENGIPKDNVLIINLEDERLINRDYSTLLEIYRAYKESINPKGKSFIIMDEAQEVDGWEKFVRGLAEKGEAKFIITGSSSKLLDSEYATLLSGRHVVVYVHPLNLLEYKDFTRSRGNVNEYVEMGGFPAIVLSENKEDIVKSYFDTIVLKDVISRFRIQNQDELVRLAKFYITSIGSKVTFNSAAKFLKLPVKTVYNFSLYLEKAYLIFFLKRFSFSIKSQDNSPKKAYTIDSSFSSVLGINPIKARGRLLENSIASTLYLISRHAREFNLYYWYENNKEVDFVIKDHNNYRLVQVAYEIKEENTRERELSALLECANRLNVENLDVVTMNYEGEELIGGRTIKYSKANDWISKILKEYGFGV